MEKKYGLLSYNSLNIGDEIQSIAAQRFLPKVDYYIHREKLSLFKSNSNDENIHLIMNAWYMWRPNLFLPPKSIKPLCISMCIGTRIQNKRFLKKKNIDFLNSNGPIGCRDMRTLNYLKSNNIPAYFSGCLTSTLIGGERKEGNYILCVDVDDEIYEYVRDNSTCPVYNLSKFLSPYVNSKNRLKLAKIVLFAYRNAKSIITTNFHTALPCLAFLTPCCLIKPNDDGGDFVGRMMGYEKILTAYSKKEFIEGNVFNFNNPKPVVQSDEFIQMKKQLEEKCKEFTGFDCKQPMFDDSFDPVLELLDCIKFRDNDLKRVLLYEGRKDIIVSFVQRMFGKTYLDSEI